MQFRKKCFHVSNQHTQFFQNVNFRAKQKTSTLKPKLLYFGIFRQEFGKTIVIF